MTTGTRRPRLVPRCAAALVALAGVLALGPSAVRAGCGEHLQRRGAGPAPAGAAHGLDAPAALPGALPLSGSPAPCTGPGCSRGHTSPVPSVPAAPLLEDPCGLAVSPGLVSPPGLSRPLRDSEQVTPICHGPDVYHPPRLSHPTR